jgi:gliding motility-associated-like protein
MRNLLLGCLLTVITTFNSSACDGLSANVVSNTYLGNGEYLLTIDICEFVSNSDGINNAAIYGIIITVNGANVIGINTPSITGITQGTTANGVQIAPNQVEYGDWGNSLAPMILDYGDPQECWTVELIVDNGAVTVDVMTSSYDGVAQPGFGMNQVNGIWTCGTGLAVPPANCNSDWSAPTLCEGSTGLIDLNATTINTGTFSGSGVNSGTGMFDPTGLSGNIPVTFLVGDSLFSCSTTHDIVILPVDQVTTDVNICQGENYTYPDGTTITNAQADDVNVSTLISAVTGCDSIITTNLYVMPNTSSVTDIVVCSGDNYTFPDGSTSTNIQAAETQVSTLQSVDGCDSTITTNISVAPPIDADISIDVNSGCIPFELTITDNSTGNPTSCLWDFGNGETSTTCGSQTVTYNDVGIFPISLLIQDGCYMDTALLSFEGVSCDIYIPNIVSLSSQSGNNTWFVTGNGLNSFNCVIVNRWGNYITTLTDVAQHWDGTTESGDIVSEGTYYYKIDLTYSNGEEDVKHGFIEVFH